MQKLSMPSTENGAAYATDILMEATRLLEDYALKNPGEKAQPANEAIQAMLRDLQSLQNHNGVDAAAIKILRDRLERSKVKMPAGTP